MRSNKRIGRSLTRKSKRGRNLPRTRTTRRPRKTRTRPRTKRRTRINQRRSRRPRTRRRSKKQRGGAEETGETEGQREAGRKAKEQLEKTFYERVTPHAIRALTDEDCEKMNQIIEIQTELETLKKEIPRLETEYQNFEINSDRCECPSGDGQTYPEWAEKCNACRSRENDESNKGRLKHTLDTSKVEKRDLETEKNRLFEELMTKYGQYRLSSLSQDDTIFGALLKECNNSRTWEVTREGDDYHISSDQGATILISKDDVDELVGRTGFSKMGKRPPPKWYTRKLNEKESTIEGRREIKAFLSS